MPPPSTRAGCRKERYQRYHEEKAKGGLALTMFGGSSIVRATLRAAFGQIDMSATTRSSRLAALLRRASTRHGAAMMCQITHLGRRDDPRTGDAGCRPSARRDPRARAPRRPQGDGRARHRPHHRRLRARRPALQGGRARRLSRPSTARPSDRPVPVAAHQPAHRRLRRLAGEPRCASASMVHEAIRSAVGDDYIVGIRFVVDEDPRGRHRLRGMRRASPDCSSATGP